MKRVAITFVSAILVFFLFLAPASRSLAQQVSQEERSMNQPARPGFFSVLGSILLTPPHLLFKTVTCVGTQVTAAVPYIATFGVEGNYDGGTNGRDIGETARRSCTGSWIIRPSQVARDYGE